MAASFTTRVALDVSSKIPDVLQEFSNEDQRQDALQHNTHMRNQQLHKGETFDEAQLATNSSQPMSQETRSSCSPIPFSFLLCPFNFKLTPRQATTNKPPKTSSREFRNKDGKTQEKEHSHPLLISFLQKQIPNLHTTFHSPFQKKYTETKNDSLQISASNFCSSSFIAPIEFHSKSRLYTR